jgi:glycosyltransferase involved in cell wall biosynthesis
MLAHRPEATGSMGRDRPRLGIAVTTFNRRQSLLDLLRSLERFTSVAFDLVVSDDGSTDGTGAMLAGTSIPHVAGRNKGIAWNKNRGLYHLVNFSAADILVLMDDDVLPQAYGWEQEWIAAAAAFGHVNYAPPHLRHHVLTGACRAADPGITHVVGGQCLAFTREALQHVGYFDPRFGQYGHEHSDVTFRCLRAGFGGVSRGPGMASYFYVIDSGLGLRDVASNSDIGSLERNGRLLMEAGHDPIFRLPWRSDAEMAEFLAEFPRLSPARCHGLVTVPSFDDGRYLSRNPDVAATGQDPFAHYIAYGKREGRELA